MAARKTAIPAAKKAPAKKAVVVEEQEFDVGNAPEEWQWETVSEESPTRVIFDEIGDTFVGEYVGTSHVQPGDEPDENNDFDLFLFRALNDELMSINQSYQLIEAMEGVKVGQWVRITYVKDVPTKRGLNPMKDFTVEVRRN